MLEQVENKIRELKKQQRDEYYKKKDSDLIQWGLTSNKKGSKSAPLVITDEEYEALIDASSGAGMPARNTMARVLNITALAIITLGIIIGFLLYNFIDESGVFYAFASVIASIVLALLFRGISEAIRLLQQLVDMKDIENARKAPKREKEFPDVQPVVVKNFSAIEVKDVEESFESDE